jgi:hypothetical protein
MVDWTTWINDDLRLLRRAGVIQDWNQVDFEAFAGSDMELNSWKRYLRYPNSQMLLGRGLYAIQIGHYFAAMDRVGKPRADFLAIQSEDLRLDTQNVYDRVLTFLDLPPRKLSDTSEVHQTRSNSTSIPDDLRKTLENLFEPYNKRLYKLLKWDHVWPYGHIYTDHKRGQNPTEYLNKPT